MASNPALTDDLREAFADVPPDERAALEALWLALGEAPAPPTPDAAWHALRARLDVPAARPPARADDRPAVRPSAPRRRAWTVVALGAAATLAAVAWFAVPVTHTAPVGETLSVAFPDGSAATLNSGATVRHARRFGSGVRAVALTGEAFFEVEPGAVPFVVSTATARVEVLGTAFNVRAEAAETAVALVHGRVRVAATAAPDASATLAPGEAVVVAPASIAAPAAADVDRAASWRRGALAFDDRTLGSVLGEIERRYGVDVAPAAGTPLDARVSAFYTSRPPLEELLGDIGAAAGVRFAPTGDGYTVRPAPASRAARRATT